ncbi:MAG: T9SS type A sorting domain-containing protein [Bacteroidia bacterium]
MKKKGILLVLILFVFTAKAQFYNHEWLIGYWPMQYSKGRISFDSTSYTYTSEFRKMPFEGTQGNICDAQGNFLMSSNGVWIANANNDTMLNGSGLNPGPYVNAFPNGLLIDHNNAFVPFPNDSSKFLLFHHTGSPNITNVPSLELFYSIIDMNLDSGLGGVDSNQKNVIIFQDTISWGFALCKHANGRDWWIVSVKDGSPIIHICLFSPNGIIINTTQVIGTFQNGYGNVCNPAFSTDGGKFSFTIYDDSLTRNSSVVICDFDRCAGQMYNTRVVSVTSNQYLFGLSFSPNGKFIYTNTSGNIFQIDESTLAIDTVATYDGFSFPIPSAATTFFEQYLAANGKIYLTSGNGVQHLHEINYPDSAGLACDVQQHAVSLGVWHFRAVPNHPNYNLGPVVGSICDTLSVGLAETAHDFRFSISPNPVSDGVVKLTYLLPQNKAGVLEVFDLTGQRVFSQQLPPWSTLQFLQLPELSNGLYTCVIRSGNEKTAKKLVVMK